MPSTAKRIRPDRELIEHVLAAGGEDLRQCMQCATCSSVCELTDAQNPGPRKEMLWAQWGLRDRLMGDADLWLCHQCGDCTRRCPRGARPGDVMAALRREAIVHYAMPRALARFANRPRSFWRILVLASLALVVLAAVWQALGWTDAELSLASERISFPFWTQLPHALLGTLFVGVLAFDIVVLVRGGRRFWRDMNVAAPGEAKQSVWESFRAAVRRIVWHDDFGLCVENRPRRISHMLVLYGMIALWLVSMWVVTARWNPLLDGLVYPLGFWHPWKMLANIAGLSVLVGVSWMLVERANKPDTAGATTYADLALLGFLLLRADRLRQRGAALPAPRAAPLRRLLRAPGGRAGPVPHLALLQAGPPGVPDTGFGARRTHRTRGLARRPAVTRPRRIVLVALALMLVPLLFTLLSFAARPAAQTTWLEPPRANTTCILQGEHKRYDHMKQLRALRDQVIRSGLRGQVTGEASQGLATCRSCHAHRELFCDKCHNRASVTLDCFSCHTY
jgi:quinone-modifying oxidoreductase, subunit QmoC